MITVDQTSVRAALDTAFPIPADEYADAFYCQRMIRALIDLTAAYKIRFGETVDEIISSGQISQAYFLRFEEKRNRIVNVPLLKERMPDLFCEVVHVPVSQAARILSGRFIYDAVKERIGDRIAMYEEVNVKDLEARLPQPELSQFLEVQTVPKGYVVYEVNT